MPDQNQAVGINQSIMQEKIAKLEQISANLSDITSKISGLSHTRSVGASASAMAGLNPELTKVTYSLSDLVQKTADFLQDTSMKFDKTDTDIAAKMNH